MTISKYDEVIDSRDVIELIKELRDEQEAGTADDNDLQLLEELVALENEAVDYAPDWQYGAELIADDYFTYYAIQMLKDSGDLPDDLPSYVEIDENATAENIKQDYTPVDFGGETFWVR